MGSLRSVLVVGVLCAAGVALGDVFYRYDEAGHLVGVSNSNDDPDGCGLPPVTCPGDPHGQPICVNGWCTIQCDSGWTDAGGWCADTSSDPEACGPDMAICPVPDHGTATCTQGVCGLSCETGFVASGTSCLSLTTDPANCGSVGKRCPQVPGYPTCCAASACGAWDGAACVNVSTDPANCGWVGHVCDPVGGKAGSCSKGRCAKATGTPRVDGVNGVASTGLLFRSPFWSGLRLTGANLQLVTWVELEDWGADTVDGTPEGLQSVPTSRIVTLPTGSRGPTIHFQQSSTALTLDAAGLEFQGAFDPGFQTRHWLKVRIHYTSSGQDRSILADVAVSLTDLVSQGLPPPTIAEVASYELAWASGYDPATGLLRTYDDLTSLPVSPSSVMSPDLRREFTVLRVAPEGLYLASGLSPGQIGTPTWDGSLEVFIVHPYLPGGSEPLMVSGRGLIVRGSSLWDDGPLHLVDEASNVVGRELPVSLFTGDRVVTSTALPIEQRFAFLELGSLRGPARTPWVLEFTGDPAVTRVEWGDAWEELDPGIDNDIASPLPVGVVMTLTGRWLARIDRMTFVGPASAAPPESPWMDQEPLERVDHTPGTNQYRVLDNEHVEVRIDASPTADRAQRRYVIYCTCPVAGRSRCYDHGSINYYRRITYEDSQHHLSGSIDTLPAPGSITIRPTCGPRPTDPGVVYVRECTAGICL